MNQGNNLLGTNNCKMEEKASGTSNRGVNVRSDSLQLETEQNVPMDYRNLQNVRNDVTNAIDLMGPNTPHYSNNPSYEADNEDSFFTSTSGLSSVQKAKQPMPRVEQTSPRDYSDLTNFQESDQTQSISIYQSHNPQRPDLVRNQQDFSYFPPNNMYYNNKNEPIRNEKFKNKLCKWFSHKNLRRKERLDLYRINITQPREEHSPPRRLIFDLIDDIPKPETQTVSTNTYPKHDGKLTRDNLGIHTHRIDQKNIRITNTIPGMEKPSQKLCDRYPSSRVDVYYFDHGNAAYFRTTDSSPLLMTELLAEKTEIYTTKFWAQIFGTIHIAFAFFTTFILQLLRFILQSLIRPLTVGLTQITSDYCFKPCLAVLFNGVIQPPMIFLFNVATSLRDLCDPIAEGIGYFFREVAMIFRAFRLIEMNKEKRCVCKPRGCKCNAHEGTQHEKDKEENLNTI